MRELGPELEAAGADCVAIGSGTPEQAAAFAEERGLDATMLSDPFLESFRAAGLERGLLRTLGPAALMRGLRIRRAGHRQGRVQGDPWQQGGTLVIGPGEAVRYHHVSEGTGDAAPRSAVIAALGAPGGA